MKILFLDQSGKPGGAELCLLDIASFYSDRCLVGLFSDGSFKALLEQHQIPTQVLTQQPIQVRKDSNLIQGLSSMSQIVPLINRVVKLSRNFDLVYVNTQKALIVGAIASFLSRKPLVYHLHDIISADHFSQINQRLIVTFANRASLVIANSKASRDAFIQAGGQADRTHIVYNGFNPDLYQTSDELRDRLRLELGLRDRFVVGHFSRLSPWKGQHVLIEALSHCPDVSAILVGGALFGEQEYVKQLHQQVEQLGLSNRVQFLGFRSDIPALMSACDLIAHTSTIPEPFGRVIVEGMLSGRPVVGAAAGGVLELVEDAVTGWLTPPEDASKLAKVILECYHQPQQAAAIAREAKQQASQKFNMTQIQQQIDQMIHQFSSS